MQRLLVASDFSKKSIPAVSRAFRLAAALSAKLTLLHVLEEPAGMNLLRPRWPTVADSDQRREAAHHRLARLRDQHANGGDVAVALGKPFVEIIRAARDADADLIVLGAHGGHILRDLLLGTTTERVVRKSERPVLIVRRTPDNGYRNVLAPVDFSESSYSALNVACELAPGASFTLLHAYDDWFEGPMRRAGANEDEITAAYRYMSTECKERLGEALARSTLTRARQIVRPGYPGAVIIDEASKIGADLVTVGAEGYGSLHHSLLGSTAERVLREAPCDVLAARAAPPQLVLP